MWKWSVVCVVSVVLLFINDVVQKFSCFERWIAYWYRGFHFTKVQIKIQDRNPAFFHSFLFCCGCTDNGPRKAKSGPTNYCPCDTTLGFGDCFFTNFFNSVCFQFRKFENYWMRPQFLLIGDTGHFVCRINEDISTTQVRFCHIRVEVLKSYCIFIPSRFHLWNRCHWGVGADSIAKATNPTITDLNGLHMEFQAATVTYILFSEQNNHPLSNITLKSNGLPKNDNMIQLFTSINQIFIIRIFSLQD